MVYEQIETDIIGDAEDKGWKTTKGWRMLLHQGLKQFKLYTGEQPPKQEMEDTLRKGLRD